MASAGEGPSGEGVTGAREEGGGGQAATGLGAVVGSTDGAATGGASVGEGLSPRSLIFLAANLPLVEVMTTWQSVVSRAYKANESHFSWVHSSTYHFSLHLKINYYRRIRPDKHACQRSL